MKDFVNSVLFGGRELCRGFRHGFNFNFIQHNLSSVSYIDHVALPVKHVILIS